MLIGEKVKLRDLRRDDVDYAYQYMNDSEVMLNMWPGIPYPMMLDSEYNWYEAQIQRKDTYNFAIEALDRGLYIGGCGVNSVDWKNSVVTVGIFIGHPDYRNKGYGTEAMKLLLDFIFNQMNVNRVQLHVYSFNERAIKSYKKNGFIEEGRMRQAVFRNGKYYDEVVMGILREEYFA